MRPGWVPAPPGFKEMLDKRQREAEMRISDTPNRGFVKSVEDKLRNIGVLRSVEMIDLGQKQDIRCEVYRGNLVFYVGKDSTDPMPISWLTDMDIERVVYLGLLNALNNLVNEVSSVVPRVVDTSRGDQLLMMFANLDRCPICKKFMVAKAWAKLLESLQRCNPNNQEIKDISVCSGSYTWGGDKICDRCEKAGKLTFKCALCGNEYPTSESEFSIGDPREHLCKTCYRTVSAEVWENKVDDLEEAHRYDYH